MSIYRRIYCTVCESEMELMAVTSIQASSVDGSVIEDKPQEAHYKCKCGEEKTIT